MPDPLAHFTGRDDEIAAFCDWLADPAPACWVWAVRGISGVGKTTLLDWLHRRECVPREVPTARLDFSGELMRSDRRLVLDTLAAQFRAAAPPEAWAAYRARRDELERQLAAWRGSTVHVHGDVHQTMTASGGVIQSAAQRGGDGSAYAEAEERAMTQMALALAQALAAEQGPVVVFCDTWEALQTGGTTGLRAWLADALFGPLRTRRPGARLVIAGRQALAYPSLQEAADPRALRAFSRAESDAYLRGRGLDDPACQAEVYAQAQGHPLLTAMWADLWAEAGGLDAADLARLSGEWTDRASADWIVGRMVTRLAQTDPRTADALRYGAVLRRLDLPALQALLPDAGLDLPWYERFVGYAFLRRTAEGVAFHELVRRVQLAWLQRHVPDEHEEGHRRALAHYEGRLESEADEDRRWAWELESLYHRWAVAPGEAVDEWGARVNDAFFHWRRGPWLALLELAEAVKRDLGLTRRTEARWLHEWGAYHQRWAGWDEALAWYERSVALGEKLGDKAGLARSYNNIGLIYDARGDYGVALEMYERSVALGEKLGDKAGLAASYNNIGEVYRARGDYGAALEMYERSVALTEELGDKAGLARSYNNIASVHYVRGDYGAALAWYERSVALTEELGDKAGLAVSYNNIGEVHRARGDYGAALEMYERSVALGEELGDKAGLAASYNNIGLIYDARGDYGAALAWYERSVALKEGLGDKAGLATSYNNIGGVYLAQGDLDSTLEWAQKALDLFKELQAWANVAQCCFNVGIVHYRLGNAEQAAALCHESVALYRRLNLPTQVEQVLSFLRQTDLPLPSGE